MELKFAVITDATEGCAFELAKSFGQNGFELLITSPRDEIFQIQEDLESLGIEVEAMKVNLSSYKGSEHLVHRIKHYGKDLSVMVLNGHDSLTGEFIKTKLHRDIEVINHSLLSLVHLSKRILPEMDYDNSPRLIFTVPKSGRHTHLEPTCEASRAFLYSFGRSLRKELKESGLSVETYALDSGSDFEGIAKNTSAVVKGKEAFIRLQGYAQKFLSQKSAH